MNRQTPIKLKIKPAWNIINTVQEKAVNYMNSMGFTKEVTEATMMCATELVENAIKYGAENKDSNSIDFDLSAENGRITVVIANGIKSERDLDNVISHIDRIRNTKDPADLYTDRLVELMNNPKPDASRLGLYRIAYEGAFSLTYRFAENILTITAVRDIH